jgi:hypothetical protein
VCKATVTAYTPLYENTAILTLRPWKVSSLNIFYALKIWKRELSSCVTSGSTDAREGPTTLDDFDDAVK